MARKSSGLFSRGEKLLASVFVAVLVATLAIAMDRPAQGQSATGFEYALPVNAGALDDVKLAKALDMAKSAGVNTISSGATWWYLSTGERTYDWGYLDRLVNAAEARGMTVKLQLSGTPDWVHPNLKGSVPNFMDRIWYPPRGSTELNHWSNFVYDMVSRYKGRVVSYEMWNEPNTVDFWKPSPNPAEYAILLRTGYLSAKSAYPSASIEFGGLSRNDIGYLGTYYAEAKKYPDATQNNYFFDVLNVHPYSSAFSTISGLEEPISPDRNTSSAIFNGTYGTVDKNFLGIEKMKSTMDNQGNFGKPIFLGEYGFSTTNTWMTATPDYKRAFYLKRAYMLARDLPYAKGMSWYYYHPTSNDGPEWTIVDANLNPTMTFRGLQQVTGAEAGGATITLSTPRCAVSGIYSVNPSYSNLGPTSNWEFYVDGASEGFYSQVPLGWDTTRVPDGIHTLMIPAYTQEGSVWPSNLVSVRVNNSAEPVTVSSLSTSASSYPAGSNVTVNATLCSRTPITMEQLAIAARIKNTGENHDFPTKFNNYSLGTSPQTVATSSVFNKPGTYVYWMAYYKNGAWHDLTPRKEFTIY